MANNKVQLSDGTVLIDLSQDTVTSAADIVSGKVGHLADGSQVTGTASGGGNDFIVTLSYDSNNNFWVPDRTWAEMEAANQAGKNIITCVDDNDYYFLDYQASGTFDGVSYSYCVAEYFHDDDSGVSGVKVYYTELYSDDEPLADPPSVSYYTDSADAVASDVANGKVFYNANGRQTGTA